MDAVVKLKERVIDDFYTLIKQLSRANPNVKYQHILTKILFIDSFHELNKIDSIYEKINDL